MLWRFPIVVVLVIALTAVQLLPFLDLVAHSQRESGYADLRWSMPGWGWANFLVPMAFGGTWDMGVFFQYGQNWTSSYYLGIGALWLALLALWKARDRLVRLLGMMTVAAVIFALGENTPVLPAVRKIIPQLSFITYPIKYVLLAVFAAPLLAAFALTNLQAIKKRIAVIGTILFLLIAAILFWAWRFPFPTDDVRATLLNGLSRTEFLFLTGGVLLLLLRKNNSAVAKFSPLLLILVAWLDVLTHEPTQNPTVQPNIYEPDMARDTLKMNPQPAFGETRAMMTPAAFFKTLRFAASDPGKNYLVNRLAYFADCNLLDGVPKTDGFLSLTPREADEVNTLLYGSTNADFPRLEDFMGVSQASDPEKIYQWHPRKTFLPLVTAGQRPVFLDDAKALQAMAQNNFDGSKIVFLPPEEKEFVTVTNQTGAKILNSKFTDQTVDIEVEAAEPSLVVIAQTYYHDWQARIDIDGRQLPLLRANVAFQAVQIPAGRHKIHLSYEDRAFQTGARISITAWLGCLACLTLFKSKPPRRQERKDG
jgi:hypothetical protein